jgi:hypothetical protein
MTDRDVKLKTTMIHPLHCIENSSDIHLLRALPIPVEAKLSFISDIQNSQAYTEYI